MELSVTPLILAHYALDVVYPHGKLLVAIVGLSIPSKLLSEFVRGWSPVQLFSQ